MNPLLSFMPCPSNHLQSTPGTGDLAMSTLANFMTSLSTRILLESRPYQSGLLIVPLALLVSNDMKIFLVFAQTGLLNPWSLSTLMFVVPFVRNPSAAPGTFSSSSMTTLVACGYFFFEKNRKVFPNSKPSRLCFMLQLEPVFFHSKATGG